MDGIRKIDSRACVHFKANICRSPYARFSMPVLFRQLVESSYFSSTLSLQVPACSLVFPLLMSLGTSFSGLFIFPVSQTATRLQATCETNLKNFQVYLRNCLPKGRSFDPHKAEAEI